MSFPGGANGKKNLPVNARDMGLIPGSEDPLEEGITTPLQYSCLENSMERVACEATVHVVAKSRTQLSPGRFSNQLILKKLNTSIQPDLGG